MLSPVQPFETPGTAAHQAPLSMEFSRQEDWRYSLLQGISSLPRGRAQASCIAGRVFTVWGTRGTSVKHISSGKEALLKWLMEDTEFWDQRRGWFQISRLFQWENGVYCAKRGRDFKRVCGSTLVWVFKFGCLCKGLIYLWMNCPSLVSACQLEVNLFLKQYEDSWFHLGERTRLCLSRSHIFLRSV